MDIDCDVEGIESLSVSVFPRPQGAGWNDLNAKKSSGLSDEADESLSLSSLKVRELHLGLGIGIGSHCPSPRYLCCSIVMGYR